mmetsp:Transcript_108838/g.289466  ORF Transcript_108838/g.289466 Transcript_108838/m.289466 type:complete len:88 (+) Transcript_108838:599-862(+)
MHSRVVKIYWTTYRPCTHKEKIDCGLRWPLMTQKCGKRGGEGKSKGKESKGKGRSECKAKARAKAAGRDVHVIPEAQHTVSSFPKAD